MTRRRNTWGMTFHAYAQKVRFEPLTDGGWRDLAETATGFDGLRDFHRDPSVLIASSVDAMAAPGRSNPIEPHAELHWDFYFYADRASADTVAVYVAVLYPDKDLPPKSEWLALKRNGDRVDIKLTDACRAGPNCQAHHTTFEKEFSLWR